MSAAPSAAEWFAWPAVEIAGWIRRQGKPLVMAWPWNGTQRAWLVNRRRRSDDESDYLAYITPLQAGLVRMAFDHGVEVLLVPGLGGDLLERGEDYVAYAAAGLQQVLDHPAWQELTSADVRVGFYGDYEFYADRVVLRPLFEVCRRIQRAFASRSGPSLLFGFMPENVPSIARMTVELYQRQGRTPTKAELVKHYYGGPITDLDIFVFSDTPHLFDVPLITTGRESLYATLGPSVLMTERQLREILYDHYVLRRTPDVDYEALSPSALQALLDEVEAQRERTVGVGRVDPLTGAWRLELANAAR